MIKNIKVFFLLISRKTANFAPQFKNRTTMAKNETPRIFVCKKKRFYPDFHFRQGNEPKMNEFILKRERFTAANKDFPYEEMERDGKKYYLLESWETYYDEKGREIYEFREAFEKKVMTSILYIEHEGFPTIRVEIGTDGVVDFYTLVDGVQGDIPDRRYVNGKLDIWEDENAGVIEPEFHNLERGKSLKKDEYGNDLLVDFSELGGGYMTYEYIYERQEMVA